jgi:teichuronic acid biosynthesis glycosyltransferase TuaG
MAKEVNDLVSIIVPVYNAERFIKETIQTVLNQTYENWELLLVNDRSTDGSAKLINSCIAKDKRIKLLENKVNTGTAITRNKGIGAAKGRYIAFLDADDQWLSTKLEKQVSFMHKMDCEFSFTSYEYADENCAPNGRIAKVPTSITHKQAMKNTTIFTSTVMFDMNKLSKDDIHMPNVKYEDSACWWKVLKKIGIAYGIQEVLTYYRRTSGTYSANKFKAVGMTWNLYRNVEKLDFFRSAYYLSHYAYNATMRRI